MKIRKGPLKSLKWIKGSHNFSVILGIYEKNQTNAFVKIAKKSACFLDLGAHVGYYSMLYRQLNSKGTIYAFEPLPDNIVYLNKHIEMNGMSDINVVNAAVSDVSTILKFDIGKSSVAGKLSEEGNVEVQCVSLKKWIAEKGIEPDLIKMDIEGHEFNVLKHISDYLKTMRPALFLSTHGDTLHTQCINLLKELGYLDFNVLSEGEGLIEKEYLIS
ncbi:MAG: FkbM family methyltransferase [Bacteroidota bacterium]